MYHIIYKITNMVNGKFYIGKHTTDDIHDSYMGSGKILKNAIKKYGKECFTKEILACALTERHAYELEREFVTSDVVNDIQSYNMKEGGGGVGIGVNHPNWGRKMPPRSEETKKKLSIALTGRKHSDEHREKNSLAKRKEKHPNWGKRGEGTSMFGRVGELNPMYGKPHPSKGKSVHTEESRNAIAASRIGKIKVTNGTTNRMVKPSEIPEGFTPVKPRP